MIEKVCTFPNQAIPAVYGDSLSYTQQVAFLQYKINECITQLNKIASGSLPLVSASENGYILQVIGGVWTATNALAQLSAKVAANQQSISYQQNEIATIQETLNGLAQTIALLNGEVI